MNKFFEIGIMITLFMVGINSFISVFGGAGELGIMGYSLETTDISVTQTDLNEDVLQQTANSIKSGVPLAIGIAFLQQIVTGTLTLAIALIGFVSAYSTVLYQALPLALHPAVSIVVVILSFIQLITVIYLFLTVLSVIRGGGT